MRIIAALAWGMMTLSAFPAAGQDRPADNGAAAVVQPAKPAPATRDRIEGLIDTLIQPVRPAAQQPGTAPLPVEPRPDPAAPVPTEPRPDPAQPTGSAGVAPSSPANASAPPRPAEAAPQPSGTSPQPTGAVEPAPEPIPPAGIAVADAAAEPLGPPVPARQADGRAFPSLLPAILGALLLAALGIYAARGHARRTRLARTRGAVACTSSLDRDSGSASTSPLRFSGPSASLRTRLDWGTTYG